MLGANQMGHVIAPKGHNSEMSIRVITPKGHYLENKGIVFKAHLACTA